MKKRILCIILAVVVIASAIGFAVYNKYGTSYDYAKKDMSKYLSVVTDKEFVQKLYDGSVTLKSVTDEEIQYALAEAFAETVEDADESTEGEFGLYDTLLCNYYIMIVEDNGEGEDPTTTTIISTADKMAVTAKTSVQLGADSDMSRLFAQMIGKNVSDSSLSAFTTGGIEAGDILYLDYVVKDGESTEKTDTYYKVTVAGTDYMEKIETGLTEKFAEKIDDVVIGTAIDLTLDDTKTATITVKYAARTIVNAGEIKTGDTVNFQYKETGSSESAEDYTAIIGTQNDAIDADLGEGFAEALAGLTIGTTGTITATVGGEDKSYSVTVEYVLPVDSSDTTREGYVAAEKFIEFTYTYPEDSEATYETDKSVSLAGKTVTCYVIVTEFYDVEYNYDSVIDDLEYEPGTEKLVDKYLTAYAAYKSAKEAYDTGAAKEGDSALSEAELEELRTEMTTAETAMNDAKTEYEAELGEDETTDENKAACAAYDESIKTTIQEEHNTEYSHAVAKIIWDKLVDLAANIELPSHAVRVAYKGLLDSFKSDYYENRDKTPYSNYSTYRAYLTQYLYAGKDYKAEVRAEAETIVRENIILYRLVELYEVTLTSNQEMMVSIYQQIGSASYAQSLYGASLFDNAMKAIVENINPEVKSAD